jgi:3-isopropylmalate/(R)-2-methylmalate dehydratase small subunit
MNGNVTGRGGEAFRTVTSRVAVFPQENVDTDQIIPARFLKIIDKGGVGTHLFEDLRRAPDGSLKSDFPLNMKENEGAAILLAGRNFGCGSSREHAPWALVGAGFRAVISTSFADIFKNNALKNGLLPVVVDAATWSALAGVASTGGQVRVDLRGQDVQWQGGKVSFGIDSFARACLLNGTDELGYILGHENEIAEYERRQERGGQS